MGKIIPILLLALVAKIWVTAVSIIGNSQNDGMFGTWGKVQMCPPNQYVYGMRLRSEMFQDGGDETALNAVELLCNDKNGTNFTAISSKQGSFGFWSTKVYSASFSDPVVGYKILIEPPQGNIDNTGANDLILYSKNGAVLRADVYTSYGVWQPVICCSNEWAVVGLVTRVEDNQGLGDDTGLNGVRLFCSPF